MLKYIFGLIFILLAWAAALVFRGVSALFWVAIAVTVLVVVGLAALAVFRALSSRRAAQALERGISDQADRDGIRPDQQAEIAAMQAEFHKAIASLRSSRLGQQGRDALGMLPWYLIIGPPGSGKTTALRNSGLQFPYAKNGRVKGVGGTRNCDWWLTNQAIMLDTAGRWSTQEDDRDEWLAFLDLLRNTRPTKPVNGIMVAISIQDLQGSEDEIVALAKALRERVDEVMGRLEMVVPVYVLVTKCDLIPGFVEMFGDLRDKERGQIWGVSLPLLASAEERNETFVAALDELCDVIEQKSMARMNEERRVDARLRIFEFPQQVAAIRQNLTDLVGELFADNVYQDAPIMRGVYLTSGTQEGRPIDRVMKSMADAFGISDRAVASVAVTRPKSYFVRDVFTSVVFPDKDVAIRSTRVLRRQRVIRLAVAGCALAAAVGVLCIPVRSYSNNRAFVQDANQFLDRLTSGRSGRGGSGLPTAQALESVEDMAKLLAEGGGGGSVLFPREDIIRQLHVAVERVVVRPILRSDLGRAAVAGGLNAPSLMDALVLHLLLTQEKQPDEPTPRTDRWKEATTLAGQKAAARWESLTGQQAASRAPRVVENLVHFYAAGIEDPADLSDRDRKFVSAARSSLIGAGDDPLQEIINDPAMPRDLKLVEVLGSAVVLFQIDGGTRKPSVAVRGAFTPAGYSVVKKRLGQMEKSQESDENDWILGRERKVRDAKTLARIKTDYFTQYVNAWKNFLLALTVREPTSLDEARVVVKKLAADKPFEAIWRNIAENLELKDDSLLGQGLALAKGSKKANPKLVAAAEGAVDDQDPDSALLQTEFEGLLRFGSVKPTGFEQYNQILVELGAAMGDQGTPDPKQFQSTVRTQRTNLSNLIARYNERGWEQGMLERILMPPLRGAETAIVGASGDLANRKWCETVVVTFDQLLAGKFPFATGKSSGDVRIADLEKFFQPATGVLWQYYNDSLQADIERTGAVFRAKEGAAVRYKDDFLKFLTRAQELTGRLFAKDPGKLGMPVEVRIRSSAQYSKIVLDVGTKKIVGLNALERWDDVPWPSRRAVLRLFVKTDEVESLGPRDEGDWALFRLLSQGQSTGKNGDFVSLSFVPTLGQGKVQVDVRPEGVRDLFSRFVLPRSITTGGGSCH